MKDPKREAAWKRAQELERESQFEQAELLIRDAMPEGFPQQSAYLYELRMERLLAAGDRAGALDAFERACEWWDKAAGWATSGGEGAALSMQRDNEIAMLRQKLKLPET